MIKFEGYTLAEVLITLVIIGIIAAMSIPTLIQYTNKEEYKTSIKKAIAVLNHTMTMQYAIEGTKISDFADGTQVLNNVFIKRLNVIKTLESDDFGDDLPGVKNVFYTSDGMRFGLDSSTKGDCAPDGSTICYTMFVDVNGSKQPNTKSIFPSGAKPAPPRIRDIYQLDIYQQRVILSGNSQLVADYIYGDKQTKY